MIGTKLAHYEINSHLGSGGMGDVYGATDSKLGRSVAVKFLPPAFTRRSRRSVRARSERSRLVESPEHCGDLWIGRSERDEVPRHGIGSRRDIGGEDRTWSDSNR